MFGGHIASHFEYSKLVMMIKSQDLVIGTGHNLKRLIQKQTRLFFLEVS